MRGTTRTAKNDTTGLGVARSPDTWGPWVSRTRQWASPSYGSAAARSVPAPSPSGSQAGERKKGVEYRTSDSLKKMDIRFAHDENTSGRHIFETNVNRFALLILQVHGAKPIDDLTQQASIRQGQTGAIDPVDNL